jgi:hypothetical protein
MPVEESPIMVQPQQLAHAVLEAGALILPEVESLAVAPDGVLEHSVHEKVVKSENIEEVIEEAVPMVAEPFSVCRSVREIKKLSCYVNVTKISWWQWHLVSVTEVH